MVGALLVLVLAFLVLRPLMKNLTRAPRLPGAAAGELAGDKVTLGGSGGAGAIKLAPSFEAQLAAARSLVGQDPKRAAQVVKEWVAPMASANDEIRRYPTRRDPAHEPRRAGCRRTC